MLFKSKHTLLITLVWCILICQMGINGIYVYSWDSDYVEISELCMESEKDLDEKEKDKSDKIQTTFKNYILSKSDITPYNYSSYSMNTLNWPDIYTPPPEAS